MNWAGNLAYRSRELLEPRTVAEVRAGVTRAADAGGRVRALGSRHSFNDIADTPDVQISTRLLTGGFALDERAAAGEHGTVDVDSGTRYGDLALWLEERGLALANLASLPHISIAGAVATGTHGSGPNVGSLATAVRGLELVDGRGEFHELTDAHPDFAGAVVGLGALGIVTRLKLAVEPTFQVAQTVYEGLTWAALLENIGPVTGAGYSVSVFTQWKDDVGQVWVKRRIAPGVRGPASADVLLELGARSASTPQHPLPGLSGDMCTEQLGIPGPWLERLPHFRLGFTPSNGEELQSEYLIPDRFAGDAIRALRALGEQIRPLLMICELRTVAADGLWLSSSYETGVLGIHFTWRRCQAEVEALLPTIEAALAPFAARPHWGKLFTMGAPDLAPLFPRFADFRTHVERYDPDGVFTNDYLLRVLGGR